MKIGYVCADPDVPLFGREGCSIHVRELTNALTDTGHDVFILCAAAGEPEGRAPLAPETRVYHLEASGLAAMAWRLVEAEPVVQERYLEYNLKSFLSSVWLETQGAKILEAERPDVLYERYALFGWAGVEMARRLAAPLILEVNAPLSREQAEWGAPALPGAAERMETEILRRADAVVVVSQWLADWVGSKGVPGGRIHVLPNGVAERLFRPDHSGSRVRHRYGLDAKRVVGYVGSFQPWHDVETLFKAFERLYRQDADLRLLLVGHGPRVEALQDLGRRLGVGPAVVFAGSVPHEAVPDFIDAMDVAVAPYGRHGGFYFSPLKLFEYMAVGTPVVAAGLGQIEETIRHGETGLLYSAGDLESLCHALNTILESPGLGLQLGQAARRKVLSEHTWRRVASRVAEVASSLLAGKKGDREGD